MNDIAFYIEPLAPVFLIAVTALITYLLGSAAYFQQKEYEAVRKRFLDDTLDLFTSHIEHCLSIHRMNWQASLAILKRFKDGGTKTPTDDLMSRVHRVAHDNLHIAAAHRMGILLDGNTSFFSMQQLLVAFTEEGAAFLEDDLICAIRLATDGRIPESKLPGTCEEYLAKIKALNGEAKPFYQLLIQASTIAHIFESQRRPTYRIVRKFSKRRDVQQALTKVDELLAVLLDRGPTPEAIVAPKDNQ